MAYTFRLAGGGAASHSVRPAIVDQVRVALGRAFCVLQEVCQALSLPSRLRAELLLVPVFRVHNQRLSIHEIARLSEYRHKYSQINTWLVISRPIERFSANHSGNTIGRSRL